MSKLLQHRPAETGTAALALAVVIAYVLGVKDQTVVLALAVVIGATPAAITWVVATIRREPPVSRRRSRRS